jgi:hypothetical protein
MIDRVQDLSIKQQAEALGMDPFGQVAEGAAIRGHDRTDARDALHMAPWRRAHWMAFSIHPLEDGAPQRIAQSFAATRVGEPWIYGRFYSDFGFRAVGKPEAGPHPDEVNCW